VEREGATVEQVRIEPSLEPVRGDPRYKAVAGE
jgi:hypothetical protein